MSNNNSKEEEIDVEQELEVITDKFEEVKLEEDDPWVSEELVRVAEAKRWREKSDGFNKHRRKHLRLFENVILREVLEEYWTEVYNRRRLHPFKPEMIYSDIFKPTCDTETKTLKRLCVIPAPRVFWDMVITMYMLIAPDLFPNEKSFATQLVKFVELAELDPREAYLNICPENWNYLAGLISGAKKLQYPAHPAECLFMARYTFVMASISDPKMLRDPFNPDLWSKELETELDKLQLKSEQDVSEYIVRAHLQ